MERQMPPRLVEEGFTEPEADAIVRRAVELQQKAESAGTVSRSALEASAEQVGVRQEFMQAAIEEVRTRQRAQVRPAVRQGQKVALLAAGIAFAIAVFLSVMIAYFTPAPVAVPEVVRPVPVQVYEGPAQTQPAPVRPAPRGGAPGSR